MANQKISDLSAAAAALLTQILEAYDPALAAGSRSVRLTIAQIFAILPVKSSQQNAGVTTVNLGTSAAAVMGSVTLPDTGTYLLSAQFLFNISGSFSADSTASFVFRRTNNTAANLGNTLPLLISNYTFGDAGKTLTVGQINMPVHSYAATAGDVVTVNGLVAAVNGGVWTCGNPWSISAVRIA